MGGHCVCVCTCMCVCECVGGWYGMARCVDDFLNRNGLDARSFDDESGVVCE
jgi:hypothetical protein